MSPMPPMTGVCRRSAVIVPKITKSARMILGGMSIHNRLAPNVSEERRQGLTALFGNQFRRYLKEMGVEPELLDIIDRNSEANRVTEMPPSEWLRLHIVTSAAL